MSRSAVSGVILDGFSKGRVNTGGGCAAINTIRKDKSDVEGTETGDQPNDVLGTVAAA